MTGATPDIRAQKADLRLRMRRALAAVPPADLAAASDAICGHLGAWEGFVRAQALLLFLPMPGECDLSPLAREAIAAGKAVHIPRAEWDSGRMAPIRITDPAADAPPDARGVPTPRQELPEATLSAIDLILVPGLSFDRRGGRLGRACGFYDRLLSDSSRRAIAIGVGLEAQIVSAVPREGHDELMNGIVTENGLIVFEDPAPEGPI